MSELKPIKTTFSRLVINDKLFSILAWNKLMANIRWGGTLAELVHVLVMSIPDSEAAGVFICHEDGTLDVYTKSSSIPFTIRKSIYVPGTWEFE